MDRQQVDDLIVTLRSEGKSIIDSIKVVRFHAGISLGEAKRFVTSHPVWKDVVLQNEPLHDYLVDDLLEADTDSPKS